jgi:hypothetical protein
VSFLPIYGTTIHEFDNVLFNDIIEISFRVKKISAFIKSIEENDDLFAKGNFPVNPRMVV